MRRVGNLRPLLRVVVLIGVVLTLAGGVGAAQAGFGLLQHTGTDNPVSDEQGSSGDEGSSQSDGGSGGEGDTGDNGSGGEGDSGGVDSGNGDEGCPPGDESTSAQSGGGGDNGGDSGNGDCGNGGGDNGNGDGDNGNGDDGCPPGDESSDAQSGGGGDNGGGNGNGDCGNGDGDNGNGDDGCPPGDESSSAQTGSGGDNGGDNGNGDCGNGDGDNGDGDNGCPPGDESSSAQSGGAGDNGNGDNGNGDGDNGNGDCDNGDGDNGDGDNGCPPDGDGDNGNGDGDNGNGDGDHGNGDNGHGNDNGNGDHGNGGNGDGGNGNGDNGNGEDCDEDQDKPGKLIVKKVVVNDDGGTATPDDFSFQVNGGSAQSFDGDGENEVTVDPGTYTVTEPPVTGYTTSYDNCSNIKVKKGKSETCTITNDDIPEGQGRVIVKKVMNGGTDTFDFSGTPSGSISEDGGTISETVEPGRYMSTEAPKEGWNLGSISCDDDNSTGNIGLRRATFNVEAGETVTCTFRNRKRSEVIVKKVMIDGTDTFEFTGTPAGTISASGATISAEVSPGSYSSTEAPEPGWDLMSITCDDRNSTGDVATRTATFNTAPGEVVMCTFTNKKRVGSIIVEKETDPDGHSQSFFFEASYDADGFSLSDGQSNDSGLLSPGTYSVAEMVPPGWDVSAVCDDESDPNRIELQAGETVKCTFTNKLRRGTIIVEKQTNPAGASGFTFTGDAAGTIGDNGQITVSNLLPGTYTSTEAAPAGWALSSIVCNDGNSSGSVSSRTATFRLEAGETVKCTFTNTKPAPAGQGAIDVSKSANPTSLKEPGGPVTYSVTIRNVSAVNVTVENVVDDRFGDLDDTDGNGCFDVPINMLPMTSVNCTFTRTITGSAGTVHVNTVTATGHDAFGNPVSDSDDARVEITPRLIDLVIVKDATSPTPLNGTVNYTMTVTNRGPDVATNVQLADPAPAGIVYLTANPSQGTCTVTPSLITCSLGTIAPGQTVTINATGRATTVGTHTNTATVTGSGGRETNPADNVDSATTVVPAPTRPPTPEPGPKPEPEVCLTLTVSPKMIRADGKPDRISVRVTAGQKRMPGVRVVVRGAGVDRTARSNRRGLAVLRVNPKKPGLITITARETKQRVCGPKRIGVVGVFRPPVTG